MLRSIEFEDFHRFLFAKMIVHHLWTKPAALTFGGTHSS
jgi:hypothetical protein